MASDRRALALKHVTKAREIVARQGDLIAAIRARGGDWEKEEDLLAVFERSLAIFEEDLAAISSEQSQAAYALNLSDQPLDSVQ